MSAQDKTLFGHPTGLYTLFFAEMWERFSYYGMRALLVFYMIKGFLKLDDGEAYAVYGAYTSLVYATPFIGGMIADKLLGARRAVVIGGLLMAAGHLLMTIERESTFYGALALLIVGNGFFKPNISTIVGSLYPEGSGKRDSGFTIFYMGINLGAAMSPLLCGYVGETFGWHYGFGLATVGMLIGLAVFVAPVRITQGLILFGALASVVGLLFFYSTPYQLAVNVLVAAALATAGVVAMIALGRGGLPAEVGQPKNPEKLQLPLLGPLKPTATVYLGTLLSIPVIMLLVQRNEFAGYALSVFGAASLIFILFEAKKADRIYRQRIAVIVVLMFFTLLFWAFFEQAGSSVNNFTDRNVDRVFETRKLGKRDVGNQLRFSMNQEQLGYRTATGTITMATLDRYRSQGNLQIDWAVEEDHIGMGIEGAEVPASIFQAANPIFILVFGIVFTLLWGGLAARGREPSTPVKFSLGLLQLGLGFGAMWYGARHTILEEWSK